MFVHKTDRKNEIPVHRPKEEFVHHHHHGGKVEHVHKPFDKSKHNHKHTYHWSTKHKNKLDEKRKQEQKNDHDFKTHIHYGEPITHQGTDKNKHSPHKGTQEFSSHMWKNNLLIDNHRDVMKQTDPYHKKQGLSFSQPLHQSHKDSPSIWHSEDDTISRPKYQFNTNLPHFHESWEATGSSEDEDTYNHHAGSYRKPLKHGNSNGSLSEQLFPEFGLDYSTEDENLSETIIKETGGPQYTFSPNRFSTKNNQRTPKLNQSVFGNKTQNTSLDLDDDYFLIDLDHISDIKDNNFTNTFETFNRKFKNSSSTIKNQKAQGQNPKNWPNSSFKVKQPNQNTHRNKTRSNPFVSTDQFFLFNQKGGIKKLPVTNMPQNQGITRKKKRPFQILGHKQNINLNKKQTIHSNKLNSPSLPNESFYHAEEDSQWPPSGRQRGNEAVILQKDKKLLPFIESTEELGTFQESNENAYHSEDDYHEEESDSNENNDTSFGNTNQVNKKNIAPSIKSKLPVKLNYRGYPRGIIKNFTNLANVREYMYRVNQSHKNNGLNSNIPLVIKQRTQKSKKQGHFHSKNPLILETLSISQGDSSQLFNKDSLFEQSSELDLKADHSHKTNGQSNQTQNRFNVGKQVYKFIQQEHKNKDHTSNKPPVQYGKDIKQVLFPPEEETDHDENDLSWLQSEGDSNHVHLHFSDSKETKGQEDDNNQKENIRQDNRQQKSNPYTHWYNVNPWMQVKQSYISRQPPNDPISQHSSPHTQPVIKQTHPIQHSFPQKHQGDPDHTAGVINFHGPRNTLNPTPNRVFLESTKHLHSYITDRPEKEIRTPFENEYQEEPAIADSKGLIYNKNANLPYFQRHQEHLRGNKKNIVNVLKDQKTSYSIPQPILRMPSCTHQKLAVPFHEHEQTNKSGKVENVDINDRESTGNH